MRWTIRWGSVSRTAILLAVGLVTEASAQTTGPAPNLCLADDPGAAAALSWQEVPSPGALAETRGKVHLVAENVSTFPLDLAIDLLGDRGGSTKRTRAKLVRGLAPRESRTIEIDLGELALPAQGIRLSGQLLASASVIAAGGCSAASCPLPTDPFDDGDDAERLTGTTRVAVPERPRIDHVLSPPLYFHKRSGGGFVVYGPEVLAERFGGGDLSGNGSGAPRGVSLQRVTDGGRGIGEHPELEREMNIPVHGGIGVSPFPPVPPDSARVCIKWEIGLTDHGRVINSGGVNLTEDYWHGYSPEVLTNGFTGLAIDAQSGGGGGGGPMIGNVAPGSGNMIVTARGVNIAVRRDSYLEFFDTNPASGCVTFPLPAGQGAFEISVQTAHRDARGNRIRVVSENEVPFAYKEIVGLPQGKTTNVAVGSFTPRATLAAITGFALFRSSLGLENKTIEVIESGPCGFSSAHVELSGLAEGFAQVQIRDGTGPDSECDSSDHRRAKFIVTHEIGHALALLAFGIEDEEPGIDYDFADPDETVCVTEGAYSPDTSEWSSTTAREGFAHFYATRVFNSPTNGNAVFTFGGRRDVERNDPHAKGGRLHNNCDGTIKEGVSTNMDWLRFYWDMHAPLSDGGPSDAELLAVYKDAVLGGSLTRANYLSEFRISIGNVLPTKKAAMIDRLNDFACWNGLQTGAFCAADFAYPDCEAPSPEQGAGFPGCPCADLEAISDPSDLLADGHFPDGSGSYVQNGAGASGQYCVDQPNGLTNQAVCGFRPYLGGDVAICELCGVDTLWGCACETDADCTEAGLDGGVTLACLGSPESGFQGDRPGTCLPSAGTQGGRDLLVDQAWFCLDNCGSKGSFDQQYACAFDQFPNALQPHGECTDVAFCSTVQTGYCEAAGLFCVPDATCSGDDANCCKPECGSKTDCELLGFPDHYQCDVVSGGVGKCVPDECIGEKIVSQAYCALYR